MTTRYNYRFLLLSTLLSILVLIAGMPISFAGTQPLNSTQTTPITKHQPTANSMTVNIPSQPVSDALQQFSEQCGIQVIFYTDMGEGISSSPVAGQFSHNDDVLNVMLASTGLGHEYINERTIAIVKASANHSALRQSVLLAQAGQRSTDAFTEVDESQNNTKKESAALPLLEEIVVIGSHIRGARSASPVFEYDKEAIELTGAASLDQFIQTLPQNFGGGANEDSGGSFSATANFGSGSSINLRGLGSESTLVLLNGRRLAPAGITGGFVDTSMIPLQAIERVEVLTDGSSALYGADAIAGVVNIIMKSDYDGAETAVRYGSVTDGDMDEYRLSQSLGNQWEDGSAFISLEYYRRDALGAEDRSYADVDLPRTLLPKQERNSLFASLNHDVTDDLTLFGDLLYSKRDAEDQTNSINFVDGIAQIESENEQTTIALGGHYNINDNWLAKLHTNYSETQLDAATLTLNPDIDTRFNDVTTEIWSFDALIDGTLFSIPGGELGLALGSTYREESLDRKEEVGGIALPKIVPPDRDVKAFFGELFIPVVGTDNAVPGIQALEFNIAARYEDYSDFGDDTTPKLGVRWEPVTGLNLRGTWGESFKAPLLPDSVESDALLVLGFPGFPLSLIRTGVAPLDAEESTHWSVGFDLQPERWPMTLSLTYFDIEYEGRIATPAFSFFEFILTPENFGSDIVVQNPSVALQDSVIAMVPPENFFSAVGPYDPNDIEFYMDQRVTNIAVEEQNGFDLTINSWVNTEWGLFDFTLNGSYLKTFDRATTPQAPSRDVRNRLLAPIDLRLRGGIAWTPSEALNTALFVNFTDDYKNVDAEETSISSWTTVDLTVNYNIGHHYRDDEWLGNMGLSVVFRNLFDRDPPFAPDPAAVANGTTGYDGTNANPLGRFISVQLTKRWM